MKDYTLRSQLTVALLWSVLWVTGSPAGEPTLGLWANPRGPSQSPVIDKEWFRTPQDAEFVEGELYVRFAPDTSAETQRAVHATAGAVEILWASDAIAGLYQVKVSVGDERVSINTYLDRPEVMYAEPCYVWYATWDPNDPEWDNLWGMRNARAYWAWDEWQGDPSTRIAIIDSGIVYTHADLAANIWTNPGEIPGNGVDDDSNGFIDDYYGYDFGESDSDPVDSVTECGFHGTHVAGTVGAVGNNGLGVVGVNWRCKLVACKVGWRRWDIPTQVWKCGIRNTVQALEYAYLQAGCRVSNNSYGGGPFNQAMYDEIQESQQYGHIFVAAAGNGGDDGIGDDNDAMPYYPASYDLPNIIAVAAIDEDNDLAGFSNFGVVSVDLAAPGVDILSTVDSSSYGTKQGTSMASPHVAGAAALILARFPELSWQRLKDRILNSASPVDGLAGRILTGGKLHVSYALRVWLDVNHDGSNVGTFWNPFWDWSSAYSNTPAGGHMGIMPATVSVGPAPLSKAMTIESYSGTAVLVP